MKESPILFSSVMVRSILSGSKTMTRRVVKGNFAPDQFIRKESGAGYGWHWPNWKGKENLWTMTGAVGIAKDAGFDVQMKCPYGKPGDRLWVRETWLKLHDNHWHERGGRDRLIERNGKPKRNAIEYRADCDGSDESERCRKELGYKWKPSIHMPRWASRLTLEITDIRVERLQEISEADAIAEGAPMFGVDPAERSRLTHYEMNHRDGFRLLWDTLNKDRGFGWDQNPWVWVIEFRRVQ